MQKFIILIFGILCVVNAFAEETKEITTQEMFDIEHSLPEITSNDAQLCLTNTEFDTTITIDSQNPIKISEYEYKCINIAPGIHKIIAKREAVAKYDTKTETTSLVNLVESKRVFMEYNSDGWGKYHAYPHTFREVSREVGLNKIRTINNRITDLESQIHCNEDSYANTKYCFSPSYSFNGAPSYYEITAYLGIDAKHPKIKGPYIIGYYRGNDWLFLDKALDSDGKNVGYKENNTDVLYNGDVKETFSLSSVNKDYLIKKIDAGIDVKLYGKKGSAIMRLPGSYIKAFLNYLDHNNL